MNRKQKTIKKEVSVEGIGLHTGKKVKLLFRPAEKNTGIQFVRVDLAEHPVIEANCSAIVDGKGMPRCTSIGRDGVIIHTVEHVMAALYGMEIDNIIIEINGEELPGLDGSCIEFLKALKVVGVVEQDALKEVFEVKEPIWVEDKGASIFIVPSDSFRISYTLDYDHPALSAQVFNKKIDGTIFEEQIACSRTFCLESEAKALQEKGLGKGANYTNTLVVGDDGVKENTLRSPEEFARHKVLDFIGDLYLLGMPICGHVVAMKSGHNLNRKLLQRISEQKEKYASQFVETGHEFAGKTVLDINDIQKILPHRYPFLFVDRVVELEPGKRAVAIKNVTANEGFFQGHFPGKPVMPGVLMVEAMAQVGGIAVLTDPQNKGKLALFMAIDKVKFRKVVEPGDQLVFEVDVMRCKSRIAQVRGVAKTGDKVVVEAELMFSFTDFSYLDN
ncbi:MAG: bifunctional UDP-3-O-[3-hydroxymyristoyl] N-acetylglucosamine deacetylase/3-hydroxyacyl-ACP dehydratase [Candidatus Omnitrophica bacterium]|nr:bifunctional UDP-3-O-[3-hydroxymyristoyl] N-acetylglucosamine deacetylase/3-hydroxyacyl-ACP dehydratase [Candidatus Omnitrophota bacterium]